MRLYHNPGCSKSRGALEWLTERGIHAEVVPYLEQPLDEAAIRSLLDKLGIAPRALMRSGEAIYLELGLDDATLTDDALIAAMAQHPILIERPILETATRAAIGRPLENFEALLGEG